MAFSDLSLELQNLLLVSHSYTIKWLVFFVFISLSGYYVFFIWKDHEPTSHITVVLFRLFFYGLGCIYLLVSPLSIFLMSPEISFYTFYSLPFIIYLVGFALFLLTVFFDIAKLGIFGMLKLGGLDVGDEGVNNFVNAWRNNKHFFKFKKAHKRDFK